MKVAIITEPPMVLIRPPRGKPFFGGSYHRIASVSGHLEQKGHRVSVFLLLPDGRLAAEDELYRFAFAQQRFEPGMFSGGESWSTILNQGEFGALIISLNTGNLVEFLTPVLQGLSSLRRQPVIFVNTGPVSARLVSSLASAHDVNVRVLNKPGVARITKAGLSEILETLERVLSS